MTWVTVFWGGSGGRTAAGLAGGGVCADAVTAQNRNAPQANQRNEDGVLMG